MDRIFNFSAGPAMMPVSVLEQAAKDMVNYKGCGMSVMEMSHRSPQYQAIIDEANSDLRKLMGISDEYEVLFLQGGATTQFSSIPMNLGARGATASYAVTGSFAKKAMQEAQKWGDVDIVGDSSDKNFSYIPKIDAASINPESKYLHITINNTIFGTMFNEIPKVNIPLVADLSSIILGKHYDVNDFDLIYAGAQKNMGPSGVTVVIIKKNLITPAAGDIPTMLRYDLAAKSGSMYNTPPCYGIYVAGLVYKWMLEQGGVAAVQKQNEHKAGLLYDAIEELSTFAPTARKEDRSLMNVTFTLNSDEATADFIKLASSRGLANLKGHRDVGGVRASLYNAVPLEGVEALVNCMKDFERGVRA